MAKQERSRRQPQAARPTHRRPTKTRRPPTQKKPRFLAKPEFREDVQGSSFLKVMHFTRQQWADTLRWGLNIALCILCLVIQDVIMSRMHLLGATTDLAAGIILLMTILAGSEVGSVFVLAASVFYYFSGSSPGPYTVALLTSLGVAATMFRQRTWHRSPSAILLCTGLTLAAYEFGVYAVGLFLGLTRWDRLFAFLLTALYTALAMIPLYHLLDRIGQIGGHTWKE